VRSAVVAVAVVAVVVVAVARGRRRAALDGRRGALELARAAAALLLLLAEAEKRRVHARRLEPHDQRQLRAVDLRNWGRNHARRRTPRAARTRSDAGVGGGRVT